jgi:hypothetical protein
MMKVDGSQPLSMIDGNDVFNIEQNQRENKGYFKEFWQSFNLIYLKHKWFDDICKYMFMISFIIELFVGFYLDWKLAFCSSSFEFINKYPSIVLIYRTFLFALTVFDLIHGIVNTHPMHEWPIYYTHLTLLITFLAIIFQLLTTYRINFYRGDHIVPRHSLQYIHIILILISLGSGFVVCLLFWTMIYNPLIRLHPPKLILDHGILWLLFLIDIFVFTRLPIYMIDCIPLLICGVIYGIFTIVVFIIKLKFSNNRIGYVYRAFDFNDSPIRVTVQIILFMFILPVGIIFILWNLFRLRRLIHLKITNEREEQDLNIIT